MESEEVNLSTQSIYEICEKQLPFYLSIGMSLDMYWDQDPYLARTYLKAFNLKQERELETKNFMAWLQGAYNNQAMYTAVVCALNPQEAKKHGIKYTEKPYELGGGDDDEEADENKIQEARQKSMEWLIDLNKILDNKFREESA